MASTDLPRVLRIPRTGGAADDFILLHVSSTGRKPHDLKLIGTDSEDVYSVKVKHNDTSTLTTKNFSGTQAQWEETLSVVLLGAEEGGFTKGVEAIAKVKSENSITITIQKSIEGIKQKYGTITLAHTNDEEISIFDWCALTVQSKEKSNKGLTDLNARLGEKDEEVKKLMDTLRELESLKKASEDDLIEKFSKLLNEKKLKVRDQQRLLSSARVDPGMLEEVERTRIPERDTPPGPSRTRKRKATAAKEESDDETDDGFEKMDVDAEPEVAERERILADEAERQTEDEQSTTDEDSDVEEEDVQLPTRNTNNAKSSGSGTVSATADAELPPKRDLPFGKKPAAPAPKPAADEGSETESDDEL